MSLRRLILMMPLFLLLAAVADAQTLRVTAERTNLRDKPATDGGIVAGVDVRGEELTVIERAGSWYRVRTRSGAEGYVSSLLVEVASGAATPAPSAPAAPAAPPAAAPPPAPAPAPPPPPPPAATFSSAQGSSGASRGKVVRVMGGLLTGYGDLGFIVTGGIGGLHLFGPEKVEVAVEGFLGRAGSSYINSWYSTTLFGGSGTVFYNFDGESFRPFVGGGLTLSVGRTSVDFDVNLPGYEEQFGYTGSSLGLHFAGGIEKPLGDRRAFRAELRSGYYQYGGTLLLLAGLSF